MYYEFSEQVNKIPGHRVLAIDRGEREEMLKVSVEILHDEAMAIILKEVIQGNSLSADVIASAAEDSFDRLIFPSLEREIRNQLTETASEQAIKVFSVNLRQLLMQPPVKGTVTLGLDPAYRTGCKIAVVDDTGRYWIPQSYIRLRRRKRWKKRRTSS